MATLSYAERPSHASGFSRRHLILPLSTVSETGPVLGEHWSCHSSETRTLSNQNGDLVLSLLH